MYKEEVPINPPSNKENPKEQEVETKEAPKINYENLYHIEEIDGKTFYFPKEKYTDYQTEDMEKPIKIPTDDIIKAKRNYPNKPLHEALDLVKKEE